MSCLYEQESTIKVDQKAFHHLLQQYLDGKCSDEEKRLIDQWYAMLNDDDRYRVSDKVINETASQVWNRMKDHIAAPSLQFYNKKPLIQRFRAGFAVAASVALILFASIYFSGIFSNSSTALLKNHKDFLEEKNNTAAIREVKLEDGSIIRLHPGSKTRYPRHFNKDKREVYLEGEAYFKVRKNPARPFYVYNDQVVTRVLGTSFTVKTFNGQTEVVVRTGKVAVYKNNNESRLDNVVITPNEKVVYDGRKKDFTISLVEDPMIIVADSSSENVQPVKFAFDDVPLTAVLSVLEKAYGIPIRVENEKLSNRLMTGDISGHGFFNKLELICQSIGAGYEIKGTEIWIKTNH